MMQTPISMLETACKLVCHVDPSIRHKAVQLLVGGLGRLDAGPGSSSVDVVFQRLCLVAVTDMLPQLRQEALEGLSGLHHASTAIKLQALSKKATLRAVVTHPSTATGTTQQQQQGQQAARGGIQQPAAKKQKQQQQQQDKPQGDTGLLDAATGALVHGTEDDIPRVRLAAVAAVVSLSSRDALFADSSAALLSDLVGDQLLEVRVAALQALLAQAQAFRKQQSQQQQGNAASRAELNDVDMAEQLHSMEQMQDMQDTAAAAAPVIDAAAAAPDSGAQGLKEQPRSRKPRKSDRQIVPPWGKDALLAAAGALSDRDRHVRLLALQLLSLLPPGNIPDLVIVIKGIATCCERFPAQDTQRIWALVDALASTRAQMITLAAAKLVPQLSSLLLPAAGAAPLAGSAAEPPGVAPAGLGTIPQTHTALPSMAASGSEGSAAAGGTHGMPMPARILSALLLAGVQQRRQGLPALLKELHKAGLAEHPLLQPWLDAVRALEEQPGDGELQQQ